MGFWGVYGPAWEGSKLAFGKMVVGIFHGYLQYCQKRKTQKKC